MSLNYYKNAIRKVKSRKWSESKSKSIGNYYIQKSNIREILYQLSGGEISEMLKDVLSNVELQQICFKYFEALKNIGKFYSEDPNLSTTAKRNLLKQLRISNISFTLANSLDFKCTKFAWKKCIVNEYKIRGILW